MAQLIDGKEIAQQIRQEIKQEVERVRESFGVIPGLAVILVGSRRDSMTYVNMKKKACEEVGINSFGFDYPDDITEEVLLQKINELNLDNNVHGILVQLPLPSHISEQRILESIHVDKDVDGLHPLNVAALSRTNTHKSNTSGLSTYHHVPCTPLGCIVLLERSGIQIEGKNAVVLGRSNMVGLPVSLLLLQKNATVTIVHSRTPDIPSVVQQADIVIAAVGRAEMVKGDWIKPGAIVIDVGINSVPDPTSKKGYKLVGDCEFESCSRVASLITPVPGGVGPMTIAMLLSNTLQSTKRSIQFF